MFENMDWIAAMRSSPVMIIIFGCSIVTVGIAIERAIYFMTRLEAPGRPGGGRGPQDHAPLG